MGYKRKSEGEREASVESESKEVFIGDVDAGSAFAGEVKSMTSVETYRRPELGRVTTAATARRMKNAMTSLFGDQNNARLKRTLSEGSP